MNNAIEQYTFIPWFRRGIANYIDIKEGDTAVTAKRATVPLILGVNTAMIHCDGMEDDQGNSQRKVELYGPGDVLGFDARVIVRTFPKEDVGDFPPHLFPFVEFDLADFPWMLTPFKANPENPDRLKTWISLVVLREDEFSMKYKSSDRPLPTITVASAASSLPDCVENWAWAHVQVTDPILDINDIQEGGIIAKEKMDEARDTIESLLANEPERVISRLLCPRRLEAGTLYHLFIVPSFKRGVLAGLGNTQEAIDGADLFDPAWATEDTDVELPVYYHLRFHTGMKGDFESLVRLLEPRKIDKRVGLRNMNVGNAGYGLPPLVVAENDPENQAVLKLEGALRAVTTASTKWPANAFDEFQETLSTHVLNHVAESLTDTRGQIPLVGPPIYGQWYIGRHRVSPTTSHWMDRFNLDPRWRAVAGFGGKVVQDNEQQLLESAWRQAGEVEDANRAIAEAGLGQALSLNIMKNRIEKLSKGDVLRLFSPLYSRVLMRHRDQSSVKKLTVQRIFAQSPVPGAVFQPSFRRLTRAGGPIKKRMGDTVHPKDIIDRLNDGDIAAAGTAPLPDGSIRWGDIVDQYRPGWARGLLWKIVRFIPFILIVIAVILGVLAVVLPLFGVTLPGNHILRSLPAIICALAAFLVRRFFARAYFADRIDENSLTVELLDSAHPPEDFREKTGIDPDVFNQKALRLQEFLQFHPEEHRFPQKIDLDEAYNTLSSELNPGKTILAALRKRIQFPGKVLDTLNPVMVYPKINQPMYQFLGQEEIIPGLEYIPENTIGLLKTNTRFLLSYMLSINDRFAESLRDAEFPTDLRGTYFSYFWDKNGVVLKAEEKEEITEDAVEALGQDWDTLDEKEKENEIDKRFKERLKDIIPIHVWQRNCDAVSFEDEKLVLLIRGNLLRRFPNTIVYAARAKWIVEENDEEDNGEDIFVRRPIFDFSDENTRTFIFSGKLDPDITFFGFDLTLEEARGKPDKADGNPGWFFVLEEPVSEATMGFDVPPPEGEEVQLTTWEDANWIHFEDSLSEAEYLSDLSTLVASGKRIERYVYDDDGNQVLDGNGDPVMEITEPRNIIWAANAACVAWITMQKPVRIAIHADDMLPEEEGEA